jgi:hypothetical protein
VSYAQLHNVHRPQNQPFLCQTTAFPSKIAAMLGGIFGRAFVFW